MDGNGRIGRLLITFLLCQRGALQFPLLYLSYYLKAHRSQYYDRLMAIRNEGDWEGWLKFFLRGVDQVSRSATATARAILQLRDQHRAMIAQSLSGSTYGLQLHDYLFMRPILSVRMVEERLKCTYATAGKLVEQFEALGLLHEITGWQRNRLYRYEPYLALFDSPPADDDMPNVRAVQMTSGIDT